MVDVQVCWATLSTARVGLHDLLDATERSRLDSLDLPADRARFLVGAALLRTAAGRAVSTSPAKVEIDRTCTECGAPHGRPRINDGPQVSVSHSGVLVVVATCAGTSVGVDVQRVSDLAGQDAASWTRRESHFKACGTLESPSRSATIDLRAPLPGYAAALTVAEAEPPHVHVVAAHDLAGWLPDVRHGAVSSAAATVASSASSSKYGQVATVKVEFTEGHVSRDSIPYQASSKPEMPTEPIRKY